MQKFIKLNFRLPKIKKKEYYKLNFYWKIIFSVAFMKSNRKLGYMYVYISTYA